LANPTVSGLAVLLVGWLAKTLFFSRRLYLIQPKLFDYSDLVSRNNSKTLELTVINSGSLPEEDVRIQLSPLFTYTVLAADYAGLVISKDGVLELDRLSPQQNVTVVLTAEGGEFRKEHVVGVTSKSTVGKVKDSLQEAQFTPMMNIGMVLLIFGALPMLGYFFGNIFREEMWPVVRYQLSSERELPFEVTFDEAKNAEDRKEEARFREMFSVQRISRKGDFIELTLKLSNTTAEKVTYTVISTTPVEDLRDEYPGFVDYAEIDVVVMPGSKATVQIEDFLPEFVEPQILELMVRLEGSFGSMVLRQDVVAIDGKKAVVN
jgi:hypothetical protein